MTSQVRYPNIYVDLSDVDGNAYTIMGIVSNALRAHHVREDEIQEFYGAASSGTFNDLIRICGMWVNVV